MKKKDIFERLRGDMEQVPVPYQWDKVTGAAAQHEPEKAIRPQPKRQPVYRKAWSMAAAAAMLLLIVTAVMVHKRQPWKSPDPLITMPELQTQSSSTQPEFTVPLTKGPSDEDLSTTKGAANASDKTSSKAIPATSPQTQPASTAESIPVPNMPMQVTYNVTQGDWPQYKNAAEVVGKADLVFEGKVTGISFQVLDMTTGLPPTSDTEEWHRCLYTFYDVEITTVYKGDERRTIQVVMNGGLRDVRVDEQLRVLGEDAPKGIPLVAGMLVLANGKTYLFAVKKNGTLPAFILNTNQSVYDLVNPSVKQANVSANDVIALFE